MVCEHTGKAFYERKKQLFREWYYKNLAHKEFREKMREKNRASYKKTRENMKQLKEMNDELVKENLQLRLIIDDLKEMIDFEEEEVET